MEDIFSVAGGHDHTPLPAGTVSGGLDGQGHLGFAAQPGLRAFGRDVFNHPSGYGQGGGSNQLTALTVPNGPGSGSSWIADVARGGRAGTGSPGGRWLRLVPAPPARGPAGGTARAGMIPSPPRTAPARVSAITAEARAGRPIRLLILLALTLGVLAGCGTAATPAAAPARGGGYPTFLPKNTLNYHSDTVLTGTAQRPALTNQGDGVQVKTPQWSVLVTVSGPEVPGEGLPFQATATTCTWVVTMSAATGPVPISTGDFTSIDVDNHVYRPALVPGQPKPPAVLRPGQKASFELRAVEAVGEGLMRWAPNGHNIVAKWDFVVEND